ncbi:hypothetical protein NODU109028_14460 [Nocardioides dubius]|uniref:Uncharacterized protein n=1 Tax=Nocardioides dubius TaxID=317019 RepID=A0ABN1TZ81_9ACTN
MDPSLLVSAVLSCSLGSVLLALGRWALRAGGDLVPQWRTPEDREHGARVYRRGAFACLGAGTLLLAVGLAALGSAAF